MFETPPPPASADLAELEDPVGSVISVDLSRLFLRLCLCLAEPMVADLAAREATLRQPGGVGLVRHLHAQRLHRRIDPDVFRLLAGCVSLEHSAAALCRVENVLREQFAAVVETAAGHLLSHDREVAVQMVAVAATMGAREVRCAVAAILAEVRTES